MSRIEQNINLSPRLCRGSTKDSLEGEDFFSRAVLKAAQKIALGDGAREYCLKGRAEDCLELGAEGCIEGDVEKCLEGLYRAQTRTKQRTLSKAMLRTDL